MTGALLQRAAGATAPRPRSRNPFNLEDRKPRSVLGREQIEGSKP